VDPGAGVSERLPFDLATSAYHAHDGVLGEADGFTVARERDEYAMHGRAIRGNPVLTDAEQVWTVYADWYVFTLAGDDPAACLAQLREHARSWPCAYSDRYLAEVVPRLLVAAERQAALKERRDVATWARRDHGNINSL